MAVWDSLFAIFVVAPLLTGGVWLRKPGFHLELTQAGPAALLLVLALLLILRRSGRAALEKSFFCRRALRAWSGWCSWLRGSPRCALASAWALNASLWFASSAERHRAFGSGLADLGIFTNAIWNLSRLGFPYSSLKGGQSLLVDHQIYLLYPLGWVFRLWPSPLFLLLLQAALLSSGAVALYLLGRQRLAADHPALPWLPWMYWLCGPIRAANLFDFHPEVLMLPAFLFALYFLQEKGGGRRLAGLLFLLLALAAKESAGPVACGLGLAWLLGAGPAATRAFTRLSGAGLTLAGAALFVFNSRMLPPLLGGSYSYGELYAPFGAGMVDLALAPVAYPREFFSRLFLSAARWKFLFGLLLPLAFLPLAAPRAAVAALPGFLMLFLTRGDHRISLGYHYSIEPLSGLLAAVPLALEKLSRQSLWLPAIAVAGLLSYGRSDPFYWRIYSASPHQLWLRDKLLPSMRAEASVAASYGLVPQLSTRRWVNQIPHYLTAEQRPVDCVLIESAVNNTPMSDEMIESARKTAAGAGYTEELRCGTLSVLRRAGGELCVPQPPACPEGAG